MRNARHNDLVVKNKPIKKTTSISDVASQAGVSIATVSRVLNTPGVVSPETTKRVNQAIRKLEYHPNRFAKGLASKRSRLIGIALPDLHGDFFSELICSADRHACSLGYNLLIGSSTHGVLSEQDMPAAAMGIIDGLVTMVTESSQLDLKHLGHFRVPVVVIGTASDQSTANVTIDQSTGTKQAAEHLLDGTAPGRCYFVGGHRGNTDSDARTNAFRFALMEHGHKVRDDQVAHGEFSVDWGWDWATRMLQRAALRGASVLAGNDEIAIGILDAARDAGLSVPGDVRVVGFDDTRLCTMFRPKLSSVSVPIAQAARAGVDTLVQLLDQPDHPPPDVCLSTTLVVRETSVVGR